MGRGLAATEAAAPSMGPCTQTLRALPVALAFRQESGVGEGQAQEPMTEASKFPQHLNRL